MNQENFQGQAHIDPINCCKWKCRAVMAVFKKEARKGKNFRKENSGEDHQRGRERGGRWVGMFCAGLNQTQQEASRHYLIGTGC